MLRILRGLSGSNAHFVSPYLVSEITVRPTMEGWLGDEKKVNENSEDGDKKKGDEHAE